ncbi:hypothetical protein KEM54_003002, partial [Ascosphaera aggregata]
MSKFYGSMNDPGKEPVKELKRSYPDESGRLLDSPDSQSIFNRRAPLHSGQDRHSSGANDSSYHLDGLSDEGAGMRRDTASGRLLEGGEDSGDNGENYLITEFPTPARRASSAMSVTSGEDVQEGVRKMEAISQTWTQRTLIIAYLGIFLISLSTSLESQTTASLTAYATSSFSTHSSISLVLVIQNVVNAVIKPPIAKIADVFGRLEAFTLSITFYILGYTQMAASSNLATYASAQIFYSVGATGIQILNQVFIADSSGLLNRGLLSKIPDLPFLATVWIGPSIAEWVLHRNGSDGVGDSWRLGYAVWIVILPLAFLPLAGTLVYNARKATEMNLLQDTTTSTTTSILSGSRGSHPGWRIAPILGVNNKSSAFIGYVKYALRYAWVELDIGGLLLLSGGVALILIPLTLINKGYNQDGGSTHNMGYPAASIMLGTMCLAIFPLWETSKRYAPKPILSLRLLKQNTAFARCRPFLLIGVGTYMFGIFLMWYNHAAGASLTQILLVQLIVGIGGGFTTVPVQLGVQASAAHRDVGAATAIFLTSLEMGGAVGSAISGAIWTKM